MTRIWWLFTIAILATAGCKSGSLSRFHSCQAHKFQPGLPEITAQISDRYGSSGANLNGNESVFTQSASNTPVIQQVSVDDATSEDLPVAPTRDFIPGVSLEYLISLALAQNPDLVILRQSEQVSRGALGVARTYPFNPSVQVQVTPYQDSRFGNLTATNHYVLLMQTIQLAHQQQFREQGAAGVLNSTRWNIHQAELQVLAQTERLYFNALYLHGVMELAAAGDRNNHELLRIVERQLEAGQATAADAAIIRIDEASTRQQLQLASANYQSAVRNLARHLGVSPEQMPSLEGRLESIRWLLPGSSIDLSVSVGGFDIEGPESDARSMVISKASSRPDVMAARSDIDVARANLCLASASKTPDLQIGPYYQTADNSTVYVGLRGQIDLPILNNGVPLERQRSAEHSQRFVTWRQAQRRAELEAVAAFDRYQTALTAISVRFDSSGADLIAAFDGLENQFMAGEVDIVRVVQARTSLLQNQRVRLDLLNEVAQSAAELTGATGIPVAEILQTQD